MTYINTATRDPKARVGGFRETKFEIEMEKEIGIGIETTGRKIDVADRWRKGRRDKVDFTMFASLIGLTNPLIDAIKVASCTRRRRNSIGD